MFEMLKGIVVGMYLSVAGLLGYVPAEEFTTIDASGDVEVVETSTMETSTLDQRMRSYDQYEVANDYERGTNSVYYNNSVVVGADLNTFEALDMEAGGPVYDAKDDGKGEILADVLNQQGEPNGWYSTDGEHIYYADSLVEGADLQTFVAVGGYRIAKDQNHLYFSGNPYSGTEMDRESFIHLGDIYYADKNNVYRFSVDGHGKLDNVDRESFIVLDDCYAKDKEHVFWCGEIIEGADVNTITVLQGSRYAKDAYNVYYHGKAVFEADADTFEMVSGPPALSTSFGADKDNVFSGLHVLVGADQDTFVIGEGYTASGVWFNAQDKNHKYAYEKIVE